MQVWVREALWHEGEILKKRGWAWMREVRIENYMTLMAAVTSHLVRAEGHVWWRVFAVIKAVALCNDVLSNIYWVCAHVLCRRACTLFQTQSPAKYAPTTIYWCTQYATLISEFLTLLCIKRKRYSCSLGCHGVSVVTVATGSDFFVVT